jgi:flagellar biosynthesis GTPase FlhF
MTADLQQALDRFKVGSDADVEQRNREVDALRFQVPDLCWPTEVKDQRKPQLIGGVAIPQRPMLSIPSLDQPIQLVLNAEKAAHLGVAIHPLSDDAEETTAEIIQGLYRRIEVESRASLARSWAFERAVKAGRGYYRVMTEPDPDSDDPFDQRIMIKRILQQGSVVLDPFAQEPDYSDGAWAFIINDMPWAAYKRRYPNSEMASFSEDELSAVGMSTQSWVSGDEGEGRAVRVAEYYRMEYETVSRVLLDDGTDAPEGQVPPGRTARTGKEARTRQEKRPTLYWSTINAIEELEPKQEMDGRYIPIIPVVGRELIPFEQERRWVGMIEPNKDAVRLLNYSASSAVEMASLETKAPYTMVEGQEEGHEEEWQLANVRNFPYLRYRNVSLNGTPAPPPQRTQVDTSRLGPSMLLLQQAREFIHQGTGAFESALGQQSPNAKSGRAILALQNQHETGSSHFLDNLAEISLTYEAKVVLDLIPHIYDRPGRIARILDKEDEPKTVMLNAPFTMNPQTKRPQAAPMPGGPGGPMQMPGQMPGMPGQIPGQGQKKPAENYDLRKGRYGVTVSIGKSYKSRREQGADEMGNLFEANPALFPILGDIYLKFRDFPGHLEASERVKKMLPPPLQAQDAGPDPQQLQQQLQQASQMVEQLSKALDEKTQLLESDSQKLQMQAQQAQGEQQAKLEIERMRNETQLAITAMKIRADEASAIFQAEVMRVGTGMSQQFDATQQAAEQHHLQQMAAQQALQAQTQSEQDYMQSQQMSEQEASQAAQDAAMMPPDEPEVL